jgi:membrane associated rhomboid family serine protease
VDLVRGGRRRSGGGGAAPPASAGSAPGSAVSAASVRSLLGRASARNLTHSGAASSPSPHPIFRADHAPPPPTVLASTTAHDDDVLHPSIHHVEGAPQEDGASSAGGAAAAAVPRIAGASSRNLARGVYRDPGADDDDDDDGDGDGDGGDPRDVDVPRGGGGGGGVPRFTSRTRSALPGGGMAAPDGTSRLPLAVVVKRDADRLDPALGPVARRGSRTDDMRRGDASGSGRPSSWSGARRGDDGGGGSKGRGGRTEDDRRTRAHQHHHHHHHHHHRSDAAPTGPDGAAPPEVRPSVALDADGNPILVDERGQVLFGDDGQPLRPPPGYNRPPPAVPWFSFLMFAGCIAGFGVSLWKTGGFAELKDNPTLGPTADALVWAGAKVTAKIVDERQYWRLITPLWLHAGSVHLVTNMTMLYRYGFQLESTAGTAKFASLYLLSGVFSMLVSCVFAPTSITVGASGALFGIFGAFLAELIQNWHLVPTRRERLCSLFSLTFSILLNLAVGILPFVDNFAHLGGLIGGVLLGFPLLIYLWNGPKDGCSTRQAVGGAVGAVGFAVIFVLVLGLLIAGVNASSFCTWCRYISCVPSPWWTCPS